ncbi:MAG TPA: hypothetical protein VJL59_07275 [Anaerolineales bacterium]|nr:hypothetical protein [Anaerolineales bacterium]
MNDWVLERIQGGLAWVRTSQGIARQWRISIFVAEDKCWHVGSFVNRNGVMSKAAFNSRRSSSEGIDLCLKWVHQLLSNNDESVFDAQVARRLLLQRQHQQD